MPTSGTTFAQVLAVRLARGASEPLVTAYDDATGERVELSVTTYANWVAKTANLLTDELELGRGDVVRLELPAHWLTTVFLGAAWSTGAAISCAPEVAAALVVCGPAGPTTDPGSATVLACSLHPFGLAFTGPLPPGAQDYGLLWPGQPDLFVPSDPATADDVAWLDPGRPTTQAQLLASDPLPAGTRLLTDHDPAADRGAALVGPLAAGGSLVLVRNAVAVGWDDRATSEQATLVWKAQPARG